EVGRGDFFHIPPRLVHRDVNPDKEQELVVVNILVGKGDQVINVKSPKQGLRSKNPTGENDGSKGVLERERFGYLSNFVHEKVSSCTEPRNERRGIGYILSLTPACL